jgi:type IV pilus assembly protein PilV
MIVNVNQYKHIMNKNLTHKFVKFTPIKSMAKLQQGVVLLEALIAILIFSFGILALAGLQAAMMKNNSDATYRAEASYLVQQRMNEMLTYPLGLGTIGGTGLTVAGLPDGRLYITSISAGKLLFRVTWQVPGEPLHQYQAVTSIFSAT